MSTKFGSQQNQSPEDNTGGGRTNTSRDTTISIETRAQLFRRLPCTTRQLPYRPPRLASPKLKSPVGFGKALFVDGPAPTYLRADPGPGLPFWGGHSTVWGGLARWGGGSLLSVLVGAAEPAAVCRWGLCPRCLGGGEVFFGGIHIGRCSSGGVHIINNPLPRRVWQR